MKRFFAVLLLLAAPARAAPFNPVQFFNGHVTSWGVEENRAGAPIAIVTTECDGHPAGGAGIEMVQTLHIGAAPPQTRIWLMRQTGPLTFTATANDMAGTAQGTVSGRVFHWRWILRTHPGDLLANVTMEQWMYMLDDGDVMIRTVVRKLGFRIVEVSEVFTHEK
jgi:hypothetical protein